MARQFTTYSIVGNGNDYRKVLAQLYAHFNGTSTHWQLKVGATFPVMSVDAGDNGFILESLGANTGNILFSTAYYYSGGSDPEHAKIPAGTAIGNLASSADQLLVSVDPGGVITDMRTGTWNAGSRWSGWATDQGGQSSGSDCTKIRIIEDENYIHVVFYSNSAAEYTSSTCAGMMDPLGAKATGWFVLGGYFHNWYSTSYNDEGGYEAFNGQWTYLKALPYCQVSGGGGGFRGSSEDDGLGDFELTKVTLHSPQDPASSSLQNWNCIGVHPAMYAGPRTQTAGAQWDDGGANVIGLACCQGCFVMPDDGVTAY